MVSIFRSLLRLSVRAAAALRRRRGRRPTLSIVGARDPGSAGAGDPPATPDESARISLWPPA